MKEKLKKKNSYRNIEKEENGITLVALVVTIIILLILAGVVIATLTGDNGILKKANKSASINAIATAEEQLKLKVQEISMETQIEETTIPGTTLKTKLISLFGDSGTKDITTALGISESKIKVTSTVNGTNVIVKIIYNEDTENQEILTVDLETGTIGEATAGNYGKIEIKKNNIAINVSTDIVVGDEVTIGDEHFYVLVNDTTKVTLLAKYCINTNTLIQANETLDTLSIALSTGSFFLESNLTYPHHFTEEDYLYSKNYTLYYANQYGKKMGSTGRLMYCDEIIPALNSDLKDIICGWNIDAVDGKLIYWLGYCYAHDNWDCDVVTVTGEGRHRL